MHRRIRSLLLLLTFSLACCLVACPPSTKRGGKGVKQVPTSEKAGLFSVDGMSAAIEEIDAVRNGALITELRAKYEKMFKTDPKNPFKRFLWAYALEDRNEAWQELVKVTKLNSKFYWAYVGMGVILDGWKVYDQSKKNFEQALALGSGIAIGYGYYGRMRLHKGDHPKALELLTKAVELNPDQVLFRLDLARAFQAGGMKAEAKTEYLKVISVRAESFAAHAELAALLQDLGEKKAAIESYAKAATLDAKHYLVRLSRAKLLAETDQVEPAIAAYQEACELKPSELTCWQALDGLAEKAGKQDLRILANELIVKYDAGNVPAHKYLAPVYLGQGSIEKALPSYQLVLIKEKQNTEALAGLAQIYEKGEQFSKALEFNQRLLALDAEHVSAKQAMERLFNRFHILPTVISGKSPEKVFAANRRQIASVYLLRLKKRSGIRGDLLIKVGVDNDGLVQDVNVAKDTVGDQVLALCAVWNLKRSRFPTGFGATYDFELTLKPGDK